MILSDRDIRRALESGRVEITYPGLPEAAWPSPHVHASSMDLHLGSTFKIYEHSTFAVLDPKDPETFTNKMRTITVKPGEPFIVQPGEFALGVTQEWITVPDDLVVRVEGRSSLGRLGIIVHSTAGFVDPGFSGTLTLEISNLNRLPVALYPEMRICQVAFLKMSSPAEVTYDRKPGSKYMGQSVPVESRLAQDPEFRADGPSTRPPRRTRSGSFDSRQKVVGVRRRRTTTMSERPKGANRMVVPAGRNHNRISVRPQPRPCCCARRKTLPPFP